MELRGSEQPLSSTAHSYSLTLADIRAIRLESVCPGLVRESGPRESGTLNSLATMALNRRRYITAACRCATKLGYHRVPGGPEGRADL